MEEFEKTAEQAVWQRVFARQEEAQGTQLRDLQRTAQELASGYRTLAGTLTGRGKELARELYEGESRIFASLRGLGILSGGGEEVLKTWNPARESPRKLLEKCYHRTRRCQIEYMARSAEGEWGVVFQILADRAREQCARITELLGSLPQDIRTDGTRHKP